MLKPGSETPFHRDYPEWLYGVRLHIPIITNPNCIFEYEHEARHLPADGRAYLLKINRIHRVCNFGVSDRIHFLCDFFDTKQKTNFNKFTERDRLNLKGIKL
jgi:aspartyl/asparaginyl beta-hydroxylase (cupin superfamily)